MSDTKRCPNQCPEGIMAWMLHGDGAECLGCHKAIYHGRIGQGLVHPAATEGEPMYDEHQDDDGILLVAMRVGSQDDPAKPLRALLSVAHNVKGAVVESFEPPFTANDYERLRRAGFRQLNIERDLGLAVTEEADSSAT
jgi:hypothetical protein